MITLTREEAQQVSLVEQLESVPEDAKMIYEHSPLESENIPIGALCREAAKALRAKLSEPEPEPVAWIFQHEDTGQTDCIDNQQVEWGFEKNNPRWQKIAPLYTAPPQRKECQRCGEVNPAEIHTCIPQREWVGLTAQDLADVGAENIIGAIWADAKLKEKNAPYI